MTMIPLPSRYQRRTLTDVLQHQAETNGDALALIADAHDGVEKRLTYSQLIRDADRFARGLLSLGIARGAHVGILAENSAAYEAIVSLVACLRAGFVAAPLNARFSSAEVEHCVTLADIEVLIFDGRKAGLPDDLAGKVPALAHWISIGSVDGCREWAALMASVPDTLDADASWPPQTEFDTTEILFTSGTTSRPKASIMSNASAVASAHGFADAMSLDRQSIFQSFFPFYTTGLLRCVLYPCWSVGATAIVDPAMDVEAILARISQERTTHYVAVPTFYAFLVENFDRGRHDMTSIKILDAGGSAMPAELTRQLLDMFPGIDVRQTYGQTEAGPSGTVLKGADALAKIGSAGKPWLDSEIRVVRADDSDAAPDEIGEIVVRGPALFKGYYKNPETTAETLRDGWLYSGDLGKFDADGFLYIVDRKKDLVIRGGHNIGTLEVESVLTKHPNVAEVVVVGIRHPKLVEDLLAVIRTVDGQDIPAEELLAHCRNHLADYKTPRKYEFVQDYPRTGMGKIMKAELRETYKDMLYR